MPRAMASADAPKVRLRAKLDNGYPLYRATEVKAGDTDVIDVRGFRRSNRKLGDSNVTEI